MNVRCAVFLLSFAGCVFQWYWVVAQDAPTQPPASAPAPVAETTAKDLRDGELAVSGRFSRFERMLSQMADILGRQDPERADLLRRAIGKGREDLVREDIEKIVELLDKGELGTATEKQTKVIASLQTLLKLLQSEDRRSSVERERERLNDLLKDVRSVLAEQRSARAATQNAEAPSSAAPGQQKALSETDKLIESMKEHDEQEAKDKAEGTDSEAPEENGEPKQGQGEEGAEQEGTKKEGESNDSPSEKGQKKPAEGDSGKPQDPSKGKKASSDEPAPSEEKSDGQQKSEGQQKSGQQKSGQQKSGKEKSGQKSAKQTPGREQLEKAREQMQQALEELREQQREKALQNEDQAIEELHEAAEKLEEMLRQLREEEKEMILASLEARFQRMLIAETQIHESTVTLAATPQKDWLDQYFGRCRELAQQQSELTTECAQTVNLLREDGTSVSILLAVEDIESDMGSVTGWLQESKVGDLTQSVQSDIIESLKQLIETTQKAMQEMKEQEQQEPQEQNGEQKSALVELMAEIRMLRNLQLQVNRRTRKVDGLLQAAQKEDRPALQKQVHELAVRQRRLIESARELSKQIQ